MILPNSPAAFVCNEIIRNIPMPNKTIDQISSFTLFPTVALFSFSSCCFLYFVFLFVLPFGLPGFLFVCAIIVTLPHKYRVPVSYTHLRAHETRHDLVCRLLLEKKKQ